jgi:hypothetical protein
MLEQLVTCTVVMFGLSLMTVGGLIHGLLRARRACDRKTYVHGRKGLIVLQVPFPLCKEESNLMILKGKV